MIHYHIMKVHDIADGLSLCRQAGWNQLASDWEIFLYLSPNQCIVANKGSKVVGTVTTIRYQKKFSWIGMVLVDPAYKRQGIGIQLLQEALQILCREETIKLDATPAGREVYLKLNFVDEYPLSRMVRIASEKQLNVSSAQTVHKNDLPKIINYDREIFGADRQPILEWMWEGASRYAFIAEEKNEVQGYCLGRNGHNFIHIGPIIAKNLEIAKDLVSATLNNCMGRSVILDILHFEPAWREWLISVGFAEQRPLIRMYRGSNRFPGVPERQYAILGPEFG